MGAGLSGIVKRLRRTGRGSPGALRIGARGHAPRPRSARTADIDAKILAATAATLADEKKAENIEVIAVDEQLKVADYFVVVTGQNRNHVRAIFNELHVRLKSMGEQHRPVEGADLGWWIVLDYGDVVVHVFQEEAREFYALESLYNECERVDWQAIDLPSFEQADAS